MTKQEFKIWLVTYGYTVKSLAAVLQITPETISRYNSIGRYPVLFQFAIKGIESMTRKGMTE